MRAYIIVLSILVLLLENSFVMAGGPPPGGGLTPPDNVSVPSASNTGTFMVSWSSVDVAYGYFVDEQKDAGAWTHVTSTQNTSTLIQDRPVGTYIYRVKACDINDTCSGYRTSNPIIVDLAPGVPTSINTPNSIDPVIGSFSISWGAASGIVHRYELEYQWRDYMQCEGLGYDHHEKQNCLSNLPASSWNNAYNGSSLSLNFTPPNDTQYRFRVRACNNTSGCGQYLTSTSWVTTDRLLVTGFIVPNENYTGNYEINWNNINHVNISRYELQEKPGRSWNTIYQGPSLRYVLANKNNGYYFYRIRACTTSACGLYGNEQQMEVILSPVAPSYLSVPTSSSTGSYTVSWGVSDGSNTDYELWEQVDYQDWILVQKNGSQSKSFTKSESSYISYKVRACRKSQCSEYLYGSISVAILRSVPEPAPSPHLEPIPSEDSSDIIGTLEGSFQVSPTGAATYQIPLAVAPGTAGVQPDLNLNYNSSAGNGLLGVGWSLGGVSAITRCRQIVEADGQSLPLTMTNTDRFCLDGQRLMLVSGVYGEPGAEYRTQLDTFARVTSYGTSGTGPTYFIVERKDGSVSQYGYNASDRIMDNENTAVTWSLNKFSDSLGNYILYHYKSTQYDEFYLDKIEYTGKDGDGAQSPYNSIEFVYEERTDDIIKYQGGLSLQTRQRLKRIDNYDLNRIFRSYHLRYYNLGDAEQSTLNSVKACTDIEGNNCIPATSFSWQTRTPEWNSNSTTAQDIDLRVALNPAYPNRMQMGDINNDGREDFIAMFGDHLSWVRNQNGLKSSVLQQDSFGEMFLNTWRLVDIDRDGDSDLFYADKSSIPGEYSWFVRLASNNNFAYIPINMGPVLSAGDSPTYQFALNKASNSQLLDFDGDGMADLITHYGYIEVRPRINGGFGEARKINLNFNDQYTQLDIDGNTYNNPQLSNIRSRPADFNGDGRVDVVAEYTYSLNNNPTPHDPCMMDDSCPPETITRWIMFLSDGESNLDFYYILDKNNVSDVVPVDYNSDGLTDLIYSDGEIGYWRHSKNTGRSFVHGGGIVTNNNDIRIGDLQTDGSLELIAFDGDNWKAYSWSGANFVFSRNLNLSGNTTSEDNFIQNYHYFSDINGDASPDFIHFELKCDSFPSEDGHLTNCALGSKANLTDYGTTHPVAVNRIVNGLNVPIEIDYCTSNNANVYTPGSGAKFLNYGNGSHVFDVVSPFLVVEAVREALPSSNDLENTRTTRYHYSEARLQAGGRGFLGFVEVRETDESTGISNTTHYRQDYPFVASPLWSERRTSNDVLLNRTSNIWIQKTTATPETYITYIEKNTQESYDLLGTKVSKVITEQTLDDHGNLKDLKTSTFSGNGYLLAIQTTNNTYTDNISNWHLGRLTNTSVTHYRSNPYSTSVLTSEFEYDPVTGMLTKEIIAPLSDNSQYLQTVYRYDNYGNQTAKAICSKHVENCGVSLETRDDDPLFINRIIRYAYDNQGRHQTQVYSSAGYLEKNVVSLGLYGPTHITTANGGWMEFAYSSFGDQFFTRSADGRYKKIEKRNCNYAATSCPSSAFYRVETITPDKPDQYEYFDKLSRPIRVSTVGFDGRWIHTDIEYNARGLETARTEPHYDGDPIYWTVLEYDVLGRVTKSTHADGSVGTINYSGLTVETINDKQQSTKKSNNALGELIQVEDSLGNITTYTYNVTGKLLSTQDPLGNTIVNTYDDYGRRISINDPDRGLTHFSYNAAGETIQTIDSKGQKIESFHDKAGRLIRRVDYAVNGKISEESRWQYDTAANGLGKLARAYKVGDKHIQDFTYDTLGRISTTATYIDMARYDQMTTYDEYGRIFQQFDAAGAHSAVRFKYNLRGYLTEQRDEISGKAYHQVLAMDARNNIVKYRHGNNVITEKTYDLQNGWIKNIITAEGAIQDWEYYYDSIGNLSWRFDTASGRALSETFQYDELNRLSQSDILGGATQTLTYDAIGNITYKSDMGDYNYTGGAACNGIEPGPHAVRNVNGISGNNDYCYDQNGNVISDGQRTLIYNVFNKPTRIQGNLGHLSYLSYAPNRDLYERREVKSNGQFTTKHFIGNVEIVVYANGDSEIRRYIASSVITKKYMSSGSHTESQYIIHKDHLGSSDAITDMAGNVIDRMSFDAFGARRNAFDWVGLDIAAYSSYSMDQYFTSKGYTGHEQLDEVGLIHMRGRVYDPRLGRFLQADPFIQTPENLQNFNRYSYVLNNPLRYTDPSGYLFENLNQFERQALSLFVMVAVTAVSSGAATPGAMMLWAAIGGFANGLVAKGTVEGAVFGMINGVLTFAFANFSYAFTSRNFINMGIKVIMHGAMGSYTQYASGGQPGRGFLVGMITSIATPAIASTNIEGASDKINFAIRTASAAILGGTTSKITGGKFINGAATAAFIWAFREAELRERIKLFERTRKAKDRRYANTVESLEGLPYVLGADGPDAYDCSGTVCYGIRETNGSFGDYTADDLYENFTSPVDGRDSLQRGNLIFYDYTSDGTIDHVTTYLSPNMLHPSQGSGELLITPITYLDNYTNNNGGTIYYSRINWGQVSQ